MDSASSTATSSTPLPYVIALSSVLTASSTSLAAHTHSHNCATLTTRMWANAQRDGRPAEHRWHPLFNAAKFGWSPLLDCRAVTLPRHKTRWNWLGCPQTRQRISAVRGPKSAILWGHLEEILLFNKFFFRLSIHALIAKIQPDKVVRWCADGDFFCVLYFPRVACSTFQTWILNLH